MSEEFMRHIENLLGEFTNHIDFFIRLGLDAVAMVLLCYVLYYRRYHNKELLTAASLFNVIIFAVLSILSDVSFGLQAGFGLFAILALFTLRSEPLGKIELTYWFGSMSIAVISAMGSSGYFMTVTCNALVVCSAWIIDNPRLLRSVETMKVTLDEIDNNLLSDKTAMRKFLSTKWDVDVMSYWVKRIDYVKDMAELEIYYRAKK